MPRRKPGRRTYAPANLEADAPRWKPHSRKCARCGSVEREWVAASGAGEVWSFTVIHAPTLPAFADRTPYGAVVVRLEEGVFLVSTLVDCPIEELTVGARVEVALTEMDAGLALPLFRRV